MAVKLVSHAVVLAFLLALICFPTGHGVYQVFQNDSTTCLYASFNGAMNIYHNTTNSSNIQVYAIKVPESSDKTTEVTGICNGNNDGDYTLVVDWLDKTNFSLTMKFKKTKSNWTLTKIILEFTTDYFGVGGKEEEEITLETEEQTLFNRTFKNNEYFYCDGCKRFYFSNRSGACIDAVCSYLTIENSRIYLGNYAKDNPKKKLCREDWIAAREIIVPIAVGGFLVFLVMILILSYIGAFIKRKIKERGTTSYRPVSQ